jgi:hypothetical protein
LVIANDYVRTCGPEEKPPDVDGASLQVDQLQLYRSSNIKNKISKQTVLRNRDFLSVFSSGIPNTGSNNNKKAEGKIN